MKIISSSSELFSAFLTWATQTSVVTPESVVTVLKSPRGHWLAVVGKEAGSHWRKDITCPTRALQQLETTLLS